MFQSHLPLRLSESKQAAIESSLKALHSETARIALVEQRLSEHEIAVQQVTDDYAQVQSKMLEDMEQRVMEGQAELRYEWAEPDLIINCMTPSRNCSTAKR